MPLLNGRFELHQPGCDGRGCVPSECVLDVEGFCGAVLEKFTRGERVAHQPGSDAFLSRDDHDEAIAFLIAASWEAWRRFNPVDDGRGTNRFGGYLVWILHRRLVDWVRQRYGSTRSPVPRAVPAALLTLTPDPGEHVTGAWLDREVDDGDLGLGAISEETREALELLGPLIGGEVETVKQLAERAQVKPRQVQKALHLVRAQARRQGLEPAGEERHRLADQVRDLREQRMSYPQIANKLGLPSSSTATALVRDYHPELIKPNRRRKLSAAEHRESHCDATMTAAHTGGREGPRG